MTLNAQPTYPSRRTYVVKVRIECAPGELTGRVENLVTGTQREFASSRELIALIVEDLARTPSADPRRLDGC